MRMKIKRICMVIAIFMCVSMSAVFAAAPFAGGEVTAPFGEENHMGHTHKGLDIGIIEDFFAVSWNG